MAVRSKQLAIGSYSSGSYATLYTVPTGYRTIIKSLWLRNTGAGSNTVHLNPHSAGGASPYFNVVLATAPGAGDSQFVSLWVVLEEGDTFKMEPVTYSVDAILSGAELLL